MKEILLTSSVLIVSLVLLRRLFGGRISRRVQYALWGLVALRLLLPIHLPALSFSVLTAAAPMEETVTAGMQAPRVYVPVERAPLTRHPEAQTAPPALPERQEGGAADVWAASDGETAVRYHALTVSEVLRLIWCGGMCVTAAWFLAVNLRFARRLRQRRRPCRAPNCPLPVYMVPEGLSSPCLFGIVRPAVYLTPAAASPEALRHVLAHELTHKRHLDPLWGLVRCVCLVVYWFDPLVWLAAVLSRRDCELACDEGALQRLGEGERIPYGQTLLHLIPAARRGDSPLLTATTMSAGKRALQERIKGIAENRRTVGLALLAVLAAAGAVCAVTFTAGKETARGSALTQEELSAYTAAFAAPYTWQDESGAACAFPPTQFLTSLYDEPQKIDLYQLFYLGLAPESVTPQERQEVVDTFYEGEDPGVDLSRVTADQADHILSRFTGLTAAETQALGMGGFRYLASRDAYYHFHGDTNALGDVTFTEGKREGDTVTLYYRTALTGTGWGAVTVTASSQADGSFSICSNQALDRAAGDEVQRAGATLLTGEELAFFNTEFFNNETVDENGGVSTNYHNQFLTCLYASPQEINLFSLFYTVSNIQTAPSQAELEALGVLAEDGSQICPTYKFTPADMDAFLLEHTGLTLEETDKVDMDRFAYLPEYDAYYITAGDTNYRSVTFISGEREGDYIRLYWKDFYYGGQTNECVTLLDRGDGQYWFVSHLLVDSVVPSAFAYPEEDPWRTIPLDGLTPYEPQKVTLQRHSNDCAQRGGGFSVDSSSGEAYSVRVYGSTDGNVYAAIMKEEAVSSRQGITRWEADVFFTAPGLVDSQDPDDAVQLFFFEDVLGYSGFTVTYRDYLSGGPGQGGEIGDVTDYYYLDEDGIPYLLARAKGDCEAIDLDGDGERELCAASGASGQVFFRRNGQLYQADVKTLLQNAWTELEYWDYAEWDLSYRRLAVFGSVTMPEWGDSAANYTLANFTRYAYFRNGELLIYKPDKDSQTADHVVGTPDVPEDVLSAARETVFEQYETYRREHPAAELDDYRVESLTYERLYAYGAGSISLYNMNYEFHAQNPGKVMLAGGSYITEEGWCMIGYPNCYYLFFLEKGGERTFLGMQMINDGGPGSETFDAFMQQWAVELRLTAPADATDRELLLQLYDGMGGAFLTYLSGLTEAEQRDICRRLRVYQTDSGSTNEQELYIQAVQTLYWVQHSYNEAQKAAFEVFLMESVRQDEARARFQALVDALVADGPLTITLLENGRSTRTLDPGSDLTAFGDSFFWTDSQWPFGDEIPTPNLTVTSRSGVYFIKVWEGRSQVYCNDGEGGYTFLAAPVSGGLDGDLPFAYLRRWYDAAA